MPSFGVPQGSILGPLLFLLYVNDLPKSTKLKSILFADDTVLISHGPDSVQLEETTTTELKNVWAWFNDNRLILNKDKTKCISFFNHDISLTLDNAKIATVKRGYAYTYLGVQIEKDLKWNLHVKQV